MRITRLLTIGLLVGSLFLAFTIRSSAQAPAAGPSVSGEILVRFAPGAEGRAKAETHRAAGGTQLDEIPRTGVQRVAVAPGDERAAIARYRRNPNVLYAEPNFIRRIPTPLAPGGGSEVVPGDHHFGEQWALHNTGQPFECIPTPFGPWCLAQGTADADIDAPEAWGVSMGSPVRVAVVDSGVDYRHPDLASQYLGGYDFLNGDADPMDDHGHGTHVAGTIAAAANNLTGAPAEEEGVVGVAPNAALLAYKVCGTDGSCSDFAIQQAIAAAVGAGAKVINMSLGAPEFSQSTNDAVQDAWRAGVVIVAGAGNDGTTGLFYPAAYDNVISVGAFDQHHGRASFSNYGTWVDISAPGSEIMSTYRLSACPASDVPGDTGCYTWNSGTSMATPHASGAAALVWSRPDVTSNSQVVSILLNSADPAGISTVRLDSWTIHGGLNLHNAITYGSTRPVADAGADQTVTDSDADGGETVRLDGSGSSDSNGTIVNHVWREGAGVIATGATADVRLSVGVHSLILEVTDNDGETDTDSLVVTVKPPNQVSVTASTTQATEAGPQNGVFTISRTGTTSTALTVLYSVTGTAASGSDYTALSGVVTIQPGSASATVAVAPIDDGIYESDESVILTILADAAYSIGSASAATVTVVSNDLPADLIVASVSVPATGGADDAVVVTDTAKNQGTGSSIASTTSFFLSTNVLLDTADVLLGSRQVPPLAPGATDTRSTTLRVPAATASGLYYVIAKADSDGAVPESTETNNVKASGLLKIGPDLIVSTLSGPATAVAGSSITVSETTKNQGGGTANGSATRFYLSANSSIDASDIMLGNRSVPPLAAGASDTGSGTALVVPASTPAGTYYVIAQGDAETVVPETAETNNTKAVSGLKIGADLIVMSVSGPISAAAGATITLTDTTKNQGTGTAAASATGFYLSTDAIIGSTDVLLGSRPVGELSAGAASTGSVPLQIPAATPIGSYYVIARTDWNNAVAESVQTNNDKAYGTLRIGGDLVVSALSVPAATVPGSITVNDTTRNDGTQAVPATSTMFYLSSNVIFDPADVLLGSRAVGSLVPAATSSAATPVAIPSGTPAGSYYVIALADGNSTVGESNESNNTRAVAVGVGPDLVVSVLSAPTSAAAGSLITATDTVKNQGTDVANATTTSFYLSANATLGAEDILLGTRTVAAIGLGLTETGAVPLVIPASTAAGTYYIIAKADGPSELPESQENNNTRIRAISITSAP